MAARTSNGSVSSRSRDRELPVPQLQEQLGGKAIETSAKVVQAMAPSGYQPARLFTVEQANACLPLVRSIVADMVSLARELMDRRQRLDQLAHGRKAREEDFYGDELRQMEEELEKDLERLNGYADELIELGVEPKGATEGLVDFPSMMDGKLVYLCWKYNEPEVLYWHTLESGFAGRQSLTAHSVPDRDADE